MRPRCRRIRVGVSARMAASGPETVAAGIAGVISPLRALTPKRGFEPSLFTTIEKHMSDQEVLDTQWAAWHVLLKSVFRLTNEGDHPAAIRLMDDFLRTETNAAVRSSAL